MYTLICVLGVSPAVVTQTLNKILCLKGPVHKVTVIHTEHPEVVEALDMLGSAWTLDGSEQYRLFPDHGTARHRERLKQDKEAILSSLMARLGEDCGNYVTQEGDEVLLQISLDTRPVKLYKDAAVTDCPKHGKMVMRPPPQYPKSIQDIDCPCSANAVQDALCEAICEIKYNSRQRVIVSLSGGRKTMSGAAAIAAQNLGVGLLCHVSDPNKEFRDPKLLQPPLESYRLIEQPFTDFSKFVELAGKNALNDTSILESGRVFRKKLAQIKDFPDGIALVAGLSTAHDFKTTNPLLKALQDAIESSDHRTPELLERYMRYLKLTTTMTSMVVRPTEAHDPVYKYDSLTLFKEDLKAYMHAKNRAMSIEFENVEEVFQDHEVINLNHDVLFYAIRQLFENAIQWEKQKVGGSFSVTYDRETGTIHVRSQKANPKNDNKKDDSEELGWGIGEQLAGFLLKGKCGSFLERPTSYGFVVEHRIRVGAPVVEELTLSESSPCRNTIE